MALASSTFIRRSIDTPLGPLLAIADESVLYSLQFENGGELRGEATLGETAPLISIHRELDLYFQGKLKEFKTPIHLEGTPFQQSVWKALTKISYGTTCSYADVAQAIHNPGAVRAVGTANGANRLTIIVPCHRVINANGGLGGYGGGLENKRFLLELEERNR